MSGERQEASSIYLSINQLMPSFEGPEHPSFPAVSIDQPAIQGHIASDDVTACPVLLFELMVEHCLVSVQYS